MRPAFLFNPVNTHRRPPIAPQDFKPARDPHNVRLIDYTHAPQRLSAARKAGVRYEKAFHSFMSKAFPRQYRSFEHKMFAFSDVTGQRCCRPDGILVPEDGNWFAIFEVKVAHISDSFWQLRHLYEPVLSRWSYLSERRPVVLEVCRRYDPAVLYPSRVKTLDIMSLDEYFAAPQNPEEVGVLVWKDK